MQSWYKLAIKAPLEETPTNAKSAAKIIQQ
jgi:hypothetical protein